MLEKIGLPAKPSMRGGSWVIDASHCQGCSSQFTFINRKHHCQRCGGLFCSNCTQQRMILRGQGDSPVRICDPCKKFEEATRFELRYGHKNRAVKGDPKMVPTPVDEVLNQILGADRPQTRLAGSEALDSVIGDIARSESIASSSNLKGGSSALGDEVDALGSISIDVHSNSSSSLDELRQQAVKEKTRYKSLKTEGKSEEALQAFKRGKELERKAGALELALRKSRRMASKTPKTSSDVAKQKTDDYENSSSRKQLPPKNDKKEKDDLTSELQALGWSDADLHKADTKPSNLTVEGELSQLLGEITKIPSQGSKSSVDRSLVVAHKKQALLLKREGKLAEAKEELKRAKLLEKQLEEQEILGEAEDSDDDLAGLIRSMDDDNHDDLLLDNLQHPSLSFEPIISVSDDLAIDGNFEVTDDDMNDPELAAALQSFGWTEEDDKQAVSHRLPSPSDPEALQDQVLSLKKEAVIQKRAGNITEAMSLLRKANLLEKDLETVQYDVRLHSSEVQQQIYNNKGTNTHTKWPPKSKLVVQRELLALKKRALALRREGRLDEAEEELRTGKILEQQLEELENASKRLVAKEGKKHLEQSSILKQDPITSDFGDDESEPEVTDQDMKDPALVSVLNSLGWDDDDNIESLSSTDKVSHLLDKNSTFENPSSAVVWKGRKNKGEIQRELLVLKRRALALRRQGKPEEAVEELEKAKALEKQLAEIEGFKSSYSIEGVANDLGCPAQEKKSDDQKASGQVQSIDADLQPTVLSKPAKDQVFSPDAADFSALTSITINPLMKSAGSGPEVLSESCFSVKAVQQPEPEFEIRIPAETRSGQSSYLIDLSSDRMIERIEPSTEELALKETRPRVQSNRHESTNNINDVHPYTLPNIQGAQQKETSVGTTGSNWSSEEKLAYGADSVKAEILSLKRKALSLKRDGKLAEARVVLKQAKVLEKNLEDGQQATGDKKDASSSLSLSNSTTQEDKSNKAHKPISGRDHFKIQQECLSHKRNALKLRREGKIAEADAEFELAKALESQLELDSQDEKMDKPVGKIEQVDDVAVDDLLDPQLMSALKAIGWEEPDFSKQSSRKQEVSPKIEKDANPCSERTHLEEQIKTEKLRALNLKRAGKQAKALEALRSAKLLEKKLASLN